MHDRQQVKIWIRQVRQQVVIFSRHIRIFPCLLLTYSLRVKLGLQEYARILLPISVEEPWGSAAETRSHIRQLQRTHSTYMYTYAQQILTKSLDETDAAATGVAIGLDGRHESGQKLMRKDKDEQRGLIACLGQVGDGHDILRQLDSRQILDILVLLVDDLRELALGTVLQLDHLLVHPHGNLRFDVRQSGAVASDEGGDRRAPVAAADDADAIVLLGRILGVGVDEDIVVGVGHFGGIGICNYYVVVWFVGIIVVAFDKGQRYADSRTVGR